jgi:pimeloyl-[acyl-carrier protein] methyl ester esterase
MSNKLFWKVSGQGQDLVLVHGWGMNSAVWQQTVTHLENNFRVHVVDLPGYGHSREYNVDTLEEIALALTCSAPKNAIWVGWSLGGLVATYMAIYYTEYVNKLVTVASSPKFSETKSPDLWHGIPARVLTNFTEQLLVNFQLTIERFMLLQTMGTPSARQDTMLLKQSVLSQPLPNPKSLLVGLQILGDVDLRTELSSISVPMLCLYGRLDGLVPVKIAKYIANYSPNSTQYIFHHSSHAPFITETNEFCAQLIEFASDYE